MRLNSLRVLLCLATAIGLTQAAWAQDAPRAAITAVEQAAPAALSRQGTPGVGVAIVFDGEPVWSGGFGVTHVETGAPVTADTVFEIASVTKPVTAWAILKLAEDGRIDLDAPIETYLGGWTLPPSDFDHALVTARAILAHGAGLSEGGDSGVEPGEVPPSLLEAANGATMEYGPVRVAHPPGEGYHYSSKGFILLEMAVEAVTGERFGDYVTREILHPLGMNDTAFGWTPELEARAAWGHDWYGNPLPHYEHATKAQGGLVATAADVARFLAASMADASGTEPGRGVITPASVRETFEPFPFAEDTVDIGLGYNLHLDGDTLVARKSGDHRGYKAVVFLMPDSKDGLVILANSDRAAPGIFADIACPWSRTLQDDPLGRVCVQLARLHKAHLGAALVLATAGASIFGAVLAGWRRDRRSVPSRYSVWRRTAAILPILVVAVWWAYWYSDIPLRLQGFPPTFYTVRATLWPTAFVWISIGVSTLGLALACLILLPRTNALETKRPSRPARSS
ncbi:serine hydrolase domain-containing protein [Jannaschia seohaensis]|uniref:CubicO group peptidase (Beta-lactamase class C family) n=1 Tax=Jannaschia seohaensis TaxID=475081 RepID=A0A2Y9C5F1_9RHOB|nr:serine hydrolase domain-containing protein [Jannaschia seohaensis]PWJ20803.1 CubicO group peptidase (beta-lactamase class C family) [Jannaschia seohaensis]SSA41213.1 CubicO group peptidase, beta-lactamase class C family [Jannaschia seohaensis]